MVSGRCYSSVQYMLACKLLSLSPPQIWMTCILSYEILTAWVHPSSFAFHMPSECLIVSAPAVWIIFWHWRRSLLTHRGGSPAPLWLHLITVCPPPTVASRTKSAAGMTECPDTWTSSRDLRSPLTTRNAQFCDGHCGMLARPGSFSQSWNAGIEVTFISPV